MARGGDPGAVRPAGSPEYARYAGFWLRLVALLLDWAILAVPQFLYLALLGAVMTATERNQSVQQAVVVGGGVLLVVLVAVFSAGMESSSFQATPGKMIMGLSVV